MGYTFVSYSRKQLYFAESLVLNLQNAGLEVWFDLQQLLPGIDWSTALEAGYKNCERLILIASRAAMQSPYVQREWETTLEKGCEVIVVMVEPVILPESLMHCPAYDFQTDFDSKLQELLAHLKSEQAARHDPVLTPGRFPLPLRMPFDIWLTIFTLVLSPLGTSLLVAFALLSQATSDENIRILLIFGGIFAFVFLVVYGWMALKFWRHTLFHASFNIANFFSSLLLLQVIFSGLCLLVADLSSPFIGSISYLFALCPLLTFYWYWRWNFSGDILRWFPSGLASQGLRRRVNQKLLTAMHGHLESEGLQFAGSTTYLIHHHPADQPFAASLEKALLQTGHRPELQQDANKHVVIVSNRTSLRWLETLEAGRTGQAIYVLATSITLSPRLHPLLNKQWVDLRSWRKEAVTAFAKSLLNIELLQRMYSLQASPENFEEFRAPVMIDIFDGTMILIAGAALAKSIQLAPLPVAVLPAILALGLLVGTEFLVMRRAALPSILAPLLRNEWSWFAMSAPFNADSLDMGPIKKRRTLRYFVFLISSFGLFMSFPY